jgi:anti-anti-sigma factor
MPITSSQAVINPGAPGDGRCTVRVRRDKGTVYVTPVGELDLAAAPLVTRRLDELRGDYWQHLVLDLRELTFMDSTGLRLAQTWERRTRESLREFTLLTGPAARHVLTVFGDPRLGEPRSAPDRSPSSRAAPGD